MKGPSQLRQILLAIVGISIALGFMAPRYRIGPVNLPPYSAELNERQREEAQRREAEEWQELDPLSLRLKTNAGVISYFNRQYEQAIAELETIRDLDPKFFAPYWGIGLCDEQLGRYELAVTQFQKSIDLSGRGANGIASLAHAYGMAGRRSNAQRIRVELEERSKGRYVSAYQLALVYLGLRRNDQAMEQLEKAYLERSTLLVYLKMDPRFDPLRPDPRFRDLLRRIGLSQQSDSSIQ